MVEADKLKFVVIFMVGLITVWATESMSDEAETNRRLHEEMKAPDRRVPVDLNDKEQRLLDAVGVVTLPNLDWLGSGFLISKCHVLTAMHVVFDLYKSEIPKHGKAVKFGAGQKDVAPFKKILIDGKVIAFDKSSYWFHQSGKIKNINPKKDWAVIKLEKSDGGRYLGEHIQPFCLPKSEIKFEEATNWKVRSVGHPKDKFDQDGKLALWQDSNCKITLLDPIIKVWKTSCQLTPGMSGGPVLTSMPVSSANASACWMPVGVNSKNNSSNEGFTHTDESRDVFLNEIAPFNEENWRSINEAMQQNPCD